MSQVLLTDYKSKEQICVEIDNSIRFSMGAMNGGPTRVFITRLKEGGGFDNEEYLVRETEAEVRRALIAAGASGQV